MKVRLKIRKHFIELVLKKQHITTEAKWNNKLHTHTLIPELSLKTFLYEYLTLEPLKSLVEEQLVFYDMKYP